jgi:hypothetical protein
MLCTSTPKPAVKATRFARDTKRRERLDPHRRPPNGRVRQIHKADANTVWENDRVSHVHLLHEYRCRGLMR